MKSIRLALVALALCCVFAQEGVAQRAEAPGVALSVSTASPNPFSNATQFSVSIPRGGLVQAEVYNLLGQRVAELFSGRIEAGEVRTLEFRADGLPAGIYLYRVQAGSQVITRQVTLMR